LKRFEVWDDQRGAASPFSVGVHLGVIPHARRGPELPLAKCHPCDRCRCQNQLDGGSHPKALREKDALCHFGLPAGRAWLNGWKKWRSLPNWPFVYAPHPLQPLRSPFLETSRRPQFRTGETAGTRCASPNGVRHAHAHRGAAAPSLYSDRARSRPCPLSNDNQPPHPLTPEAVRIHQYIRRSTLATFLRCDAVDITFTGAIVWISWQLLGQREMYALTRLRNMRAVRPRLALHIMQARKRAGRSRKTPCYRQPAVAIAGAGSPVALRRRPGTAADQWGRVRRQP